MIAARPNQIPQYDQANRPVQAEAKNSNYHMVDIKTDYRDLKLLHYLQTQWQCLANAVGWINLYLR
jgi:hypothetical protein